MESLSADTIPAGVPEGADFFDPDAGGEGAFTVPFAAGFAPVCGAGLTAAFDVCFASVFCGVGFTAGSCAAAASISRRLHSGMWADALQERSRGYSGCLE